MLTWYSPDCCYWHATALDVEGNVPSDDIWIIDERTGIVYQGNMHEGSGQMENEVRELLDS